MHANATLANGLSATMTDTAAPSIYQAVQSVDGLFGYVAAIYRAQRTKRELERLSNHVLEDIGLTIYDVPGAARRASGLR